MSKANKQTTGSIFDAKLAGRDFGKYRTEKPISKHRSRQTVAFPAIDKETKKRVMLKAFGFLSPKSIKEFEKEMAAFRKLENMHGVLLPLETFEYEGNYFIVTEYKNGGDLRKWLSGKPKVAEILDVFEQIAKSIDYIHENKIIHRDIKPENVVYEVLGGRVIPYLMDFGISETLSNKTSSFKTERAFGTIEYMAPEFFYPDAKKTKAVDIYSFGVMLYEALEGRHPFHPFGENTQEIRAQIVNGVLPAPENTIKRLGENAGAVLLKALSKNPEERPETASEIIAQVGSRRLKYAGKTYGKYIIEEYLGEGTYGVTCKAREINKKNKKVALKLLKVSEAVKPQIGGLMGLRRNQGILPVIDAGYDNGTSYLVSEYLDGENLRQTFSPAGMELRALLRILKPLAATLDYLHEKGVIHRNLKPENILFPKTRSGDNFQPFVCDYGVAQIAQAADANDNALWGNLDYLAPEILDNKEPSPAVDVYSLGVIIYEALEGKKPFGADSRSALLKQKLDGYVPVPENLLKNGGVQAARILLKALDIKPEKRQRSASSLVSQLEEASGSRSLADAKILVQPWIKTRKLLADLRKIPLLPWALLLLLLLLAFWGAFLFWRAKPSSPAPIVASSNTATAVPRTNTAAPPTAPPFSPLSVTATPASDISDKCKLPEVGPSHDYPVERNISLGDIYREKYKQEPTFREWYAIAYFNNRKILEGYNSKYDWIDPISLGVKKGWKIFIPPQEWIEKYKKFPASMPPPASNNVPTAITISGSSALSRLSAQISKCAAETIKVELKQINAGNTVSGLQDLCQGKADLFGASAEVKPAMLTERHCGGVALEKFEVARYAMVVIVNNGNPHAEEMKTEPLKLSELTKLLISAPSWKGVREYWNNDEPIARYYPPLDSGEFEIVQNGVLSDMVVAQKDIAGLIIEDDAQAAIDGVIANANAVGIVDYDSYKNCENNNLLTAIPVNGVYVSSAIAGENSASYPLVSSLYLYAEKNAYEDKDKALHSLIHYYLSHELDFLSELGYLYPSKKGYEGNPDTIP